MLPNVTIEIEGNLVKDPELQQVGDKKVCNFIVAASVGSKDENGNRKTNFFECSTWGAGGEWLFKRMQKGTGVTVKGEFEGVEVVNKETGEKRTKLRVATTNVRLRSNVKEWAEEDPTE